MRTYNDETGLHVLVSERELADLLIAHIKALPEVEKKELRDLLVGWGQAAPGTSWKTYYEEQGKKDRDL